MKKQKSCLVKINFGQNSLENLPNVVKNRRAVLITSSVFRSLGTIDKIKKLVPTLVHITDEINILPTFDLLEKAYTNVWKHSFDVIIALGGGSVIDSAKIISVYKDQPNLTPREHFAFVEKLIKNEIEKEGYRRVPVIAIPTTAGTSSDITPWATAWEASKKYSLHLPDLWCEATICDPILTLSMPKSLTIQTALDALSHSLESIWNKNHNPISTRHAIYAAKTIMKFLPLAINDLSNIEYREELMRAALHAGLAFSKTQTAIAHAMSYYMTIHKNVPHGIACSFTLPTIVDTIIGQNNRIDNALKEVFGELSSTKLRMFFSSLGVSTNFFDYDLTPDDLEKIKQTVSTNPRGKNSLVDIDQLFLCLKKESYCGTEKEI